MMSCSFKDLYQAMDYTATSWRPWQTKRVLFSYNTQLSPILCGGAGWTRRTAYYTTNMAKKKYLCPS